MSKKTFILILLTIFLISCTDIIGIGFGIGAVGIFQIAKYNSVTSTSSSSNISK